MKKTLRRTKSKSKSQTKRKLLESSQKDLLQAVVNGKVIISKGDTILIK